MKLNSGKHDRAGHGIAAFEALDAGGKLALQALLRAQDPTENPAERSRRLLRGAWGGEGRRRRCSLRRQRINWLHLGLRAGSEHASMSAPRRAR